MWGQQNICNQNYTNECSVFVIFLKISCKSWQTKVWLGQFIIIKTSFFLLKFFNIKIITLYRLYCANKIKPNYKTTLHV